MALDHGKCREEWVQCCPGNYHEITGAVRNWLMENSNQVVAVTGASGYLGSRLLLHLEDQDLEKLVGYRKPCSTEQGFLW